MWKLDFSLGYWMARVGMINYHTHTHENASNFSTMLTLITRHLIWMNQNIWDPTRARLLMLLLFLCVHESFEYQIKPQSRTHPKLFVLSICLCCSARLLSSPRMSTSLPPPPVPSTLSHRIVVGVYSLLVCPSVAALYARVFVCLSIRKKTNIFLQYLPLFF